MIEVQYRKFADGIYTVLMGGRRIGSVTRMDRSGHVAYWQAIPDCKPRTTHDAWTRAAATAKMVATVKR